MKPREGIGDDLESSSDDTPVPAAESSYLHGQAGDFSVARLELCYSPHAPPFGCICEERKCDG